MEGNCTHNPEDWNNKSINSHIHIISPCSILCSDVQFTGRYTYADPESCVKGGPTLTTFLLVDKRREDQNTIMSWPLLASQIADNDLSLNAGLVAL